MNENPIEKILSLDDAAFENLAREVASVCGVGKLKTGAMLSDIPSLKKRISKMTKSDAENIVSSVGKDKAGEVLKLLRERGMDFGS